MTTLRGSVGSPLPPTMTGRPTSSGWRRSSTEARNWSRSTCRTQSRDSAAFTVPQSLRATLSQASPSVSRVRPRSIELVGDVVGVEQRQQCVGLRVEVAGGACGVEQHPHVGVHAASTAR